MAKPTTLPRFATNAGVTTEPTESKKDAGWVTSEKPAAQVMNWLFRRIYDWCVYLDGLTGEPLTWTVRQIFQGTTNQAAIVATGGPTNAPAIQATGGGTAAAIQATGTLNGAAVECLTGGVKCSGGNPAGTVDPGANTMHASSIVKALGLFLTDGAGNVSLVNGTGLNIANQTVTTTYIEVTFARGFASANFVPIASMAANNSNRANAAPISSTTARIYFRDNTGAQVDPSTNAFSVAFIAHGYQT